MHPRMYRLAGTTLAAMALLLAGSASAAWARPFVTTRTVPAESAVKLKSQVIPRRAVVTVAAEVYRQPLRTGAARGLTYVLRGHGVIARFKCQQKRGRCSVRIANSGNQAKRVRIIITARVVREQPKADEESREPPPESEPCEPPETFAERTPLATCP